MNALKAEILKSRNSFALWLSLFGTLANVLIFFLLFFIGFNTLDGPEFDNPWNYYILGHYEGISFMMLPLYVIILCTLVTFMEEQRGMYAILNTLPVKKWNLYISKQLFIFGLFLFAHVLFVGGMLATGVILGVLQPETGLLSHFPDLLQILELTARTFISILGLGALHYWISLRYRQFIIPLTIGILGFVFVSILGPDWPYQVFVPYAYPILFIPQSTGEIQLGNGFLVELGSLAYYLVFTFLGFWDTRNNQEL